MKTNFTVILMLLLNVCFGQYGVSSGSYSMVQSNGMNSYNESGRLNDRMIIVEDFVNYHKHKISIPEKKALAVSIDYSNELTDDKSRFIMQVGLATAKKGNLEKTSADVSISLVIDQSGSMSGGKMNSVKDALKAFVKQLEDGMYLSLITFSDNAGVAVNTLKITADRDRIYRVIEGIQPNGSTNINAGMMLGYEELLKIHHKGMNSRLILLTDGMTNQGETNLEKILANSKGYNNKGIEISTIGVGDQLDFDLLRSLAENGRGSNHFIGDNEIDIQKVFITELESLLYQIGKHPEVTIALPQGYKIVKVYGYQPRYILDNKISIGLENLNADTTQVILIEVERSRMSGNELVVQMLYDIDGKAIDMTEKVRYKPGMGSTNDELSKNYCIAVMADALKQYSTDYIRGHNPSKTVLQEALAFADKHSDTNDIDVKRTYDILKKI